MAAEENRVKYPRKQINNNNSDVPICTKEKVYSAVVSPSNKCCLMMAHVQPKRIVVSNRYT
jgi:hypothetical protein